MIKKLKRKFIMITMTFITLILVTVLAILCFDSYQRTKTDITNSLNFALYKYNDHPTFEIDFSRENPKNNNDPRPNMNSFTIITDSSNNILELYSRNYQISNETSQNLIDSINDKSEGILISQNLAYKKDTKDEGYIYAFVDISIAKENLISMLMTAILIAIGSILAFLILTILLANWSLRPVAISWQQQKQFLADASHELKTPLTVILANTDLALTKKQDESKLKQSLQSIQSESMRMKKLVEDLLLLAKNDAQKENTLNTICNISDISLSCVLSFETLAFEKGVILESDIEDNLLALGNENQFKQLISIFLDNATKYTPSNKKINFTLKKKDNQIQITIYNEGSYIDKENIKHIFDRFYRCDPARQYQGGYGLGLSIASQIASNLKIKIDVNSEQKKGTTFTLWIPAK